MHFLLQSALLTHGWTVHLSANGELFDLREKSTGSVIESVGLDFAEKFLEAVGQLNECKA